jgi:hypothetical protein
MLVIMTKSRLDPQTILNNKSGLILRSKLPKAKIILSTLFVKYSIYTKLV